MRELNYAYFSKAIDIIIQEKVDFLLVAGDLFNTSFPSIDALKLVFQKFRKLKNANIPIYHIAGSHDYSPSGKTMLDILEEAELSKDVMRGTVDEEGRLHLKFTIDEKTKTKITGIIGKRGMLDRKYYEALYREDLEKEEGLKIFMFHTTINELKPKNLEKMEGSPISFLPKNFNYYAGGHVHIINAVNIEGYKNIVYPGPIFPNNFSEIEELGGGSFYIHEDNENKLIKIKIKEHLKIIIECKNKNSEEIKTELKKKLADEVTDKIITIRLKGRLEEGNLSDIGFKEIIEDLYNRGAYFVMKNISGLKIKDFEEVKINSGKIEEIEEEIISENSGQINIDLKIEEEKELIKLLIKSFDKEKDEGEKNSDYETRIINEAEDIIFNLNKILSK